uniref:Fe2OG dioxygenase domain-containing protein n=1 Tax=Odontella aurita TaxID=265563 RepID=A0A7S4HNG0_9STRA|mmetsp:Transcript_12762/g.37550  ORF Transcript_12762/g.37550 Transcript_12762/m.37550 type:complete len:378 (+) Transcript_12762:39-1172(+)
MSEDEGAGVPIIDLSLADDDLVEQIAEACSTWGFFQLTNHGFPPDLVDEFRSQMKEFFSLPHDLKICLKRDENNARGFFDDELTKRRRDWKEAIDVGVPGSRDWSVPDDDASNECLDGFNRFPAESDAPKFRPTVVRYFQACESLADRIAVLMGKGLGRGGNIETEKQKDTFFQELRTKHTSYLRMNYYPVCPSTMHSRPDDKPPPLGISPHKDAGFLTVLVQDDDCHSLQVARYPNGDESMKPRWVTVHPHPGSFTINTGDMAQIWSNGKYKAPLHRVLTNDAKVRYSAPFFYNPGYRTEIAPFLAQKPRYNPCSWGYFRAVRFAGDLTDLGIEIQISDFEKEAESPHIEKQARFTCEVDCCSRFSVEKFRPLAEV